MERSKYFNYTRPSQTQLDYTENSKARGILRRARSNLQFGTRTGFRITINATTNTQIDIGAGDGFTGGFYRSENLRGSPNSGERISTLTDAATGDPGYTRTAEGVGLIDYSANTKNYVCLKYTEAESIPLAERYYPFTNHNTIVAETYTVEVYTETQWNALTTTVLEQRILVGIVTAQGAGVALTLSNVQQMVQPKDHPIAGTQPSNITGVAITGVSNETIIGNGTLRFETATKKLYWTAPGDAEGAGVVVGASGNYTLYSDDTSYWLLIEVIFISLPAANATDTIGIESLYGRDIPMACAVDQAHRDMLGTGIKTVTNPHATSIDDITGGTYEHADLYHVNGISKDADPDQLQCSIVAANNSISIENKGSFRNSFLIKGITYDLLAGYAAGTVGSLTFSPLVPVLDSGIYLIYVANNAVPQYVKIAEYAPGAVGDITVLWDSNITIVDMHNISSGNGEIFWDNTEDTLSYESPADKAIGAGAGTLVKALDNPNLGISSPAVEGYYKLYSNNGIDWVIVYCDGNLGASNNSVFNIDKNETEHSDDEILKLAVVTWNQLGEMHANLRDIRRFNTADNRDALEEDHNEQGQHTKVLQNAFRVGVGSQVAIEGLAPNTAIQGVAITDTAIYGIAANDSAIVGLAIAGDVGVYGFAQNTGGYFDVIVDTGVYGEAGGHYGVYGSAGGNNGVYGTAVGLYGVYGKAGGNYGVFGWAVNDTGVYGTADGNFGVYGTAVGNDGVYGRAGVDRGVYGSADRHYGVHGSAVSNYGVYGKADEDFGVYGWAVGATGVYGTGGANYGVYGEAGADYGVYGEAAVNTGVFGSAGADYGVYGKAVVATGVYGTAPNYGVYGLANVDYGVCGIANNDTAVYGWALGDYGGYFKGGAVGGGTALGAEGTINYIIGLLSDGVNKAIAPKQAVPASCGMAPFEVGGVEYRVAIFDKA